MQDESVSLAEGKLTASPRSSSEGLPGKTKRREQLKKLVRGLGLDLEAVLAHMRNRR